MLNAADLVGHPSREDAAVRAVRESGLSVTGFQVLRDFEGLSGHLHAYKLDVAKAMLAMCRALGTNVLLACSSTSAHATGDKDSLIRDLRKLALLAVPYRIRIAYEALSWGRHVNRWHQAWDIVRRCDRENVGLNLDFFHMSVHGDDGAEMLAQLAEVPVEKIFLVQLADYFFEYSDRQADMIELARHQRLFPGEGLHDVRDLVQLLEDKGYRGHYTFEVFNDDYVNSDPMVIGQRAMKSARWISESHVAGARPADPRTPSP
jgi:sugar phosphate isomerase/epimerase